MTKKFLSFRDTKIWNVVKRLQELILVSCGIICTLLFVVEVIMRYLLHKDFVGYDEIVLIFAVWLFFIGGSYASYAKGHINADMLTLMLKGRRLGIAHTAVSWLTFVITVIMAIWGIQFVLSAWATSGQSTVWKIPIIWGQFAVALGYTMMSLYGLLYSVEDTILLMQHNHPDEISKEEEVQIA